MSTRSLSSLPRRNRVPSWHHPPPVRTKNRISGEDKLSEVMRKFLDDPDNCVFLHPNEKRNYTEEELMALKKRDFETKLFITGTQFVGDTVFLRSHHTDNLKHTSHFNYVRDYIKAAHVTKNQTSAKVTLTTILTMFFDCSPSEYHTFAISLSSGLSKYAKNTSFEINNTLVRSREDIDCVRGKFCLLMDVIFSKMATKKFLLDDDQSNIFRLVHCSIKYGKSKGGVLAALFSFTLQITLTAYVALHQRTSVDSENVFFDYEDVNLRMLPLAIFTFCYSIMVAMSTISDTLKAYDLVFKEVGLLMIMDLIINVCIPLALAYYGFILILCEKDYINAVLNCSALLFIPEIDDQLPQILGYREDDIIKNYLITKSMEDYDNVIELPDEDFTPIACANRNMACGLQFGDYYITNMTEEGTNSQTGLIFQPFSVSFNYDKNGPQIDPSTTITTECLLTKIEWQYTTGFPKSPSPRVGCLVLTKLGGKVIRIQRKRDPTGKVGINPDKNNLEGLFIITMFQISEDVIKLRVCGSHNQKNFLRCVEYYSLWDVSDDAKKMIYSF